MTGPKKILKIEYHCKKTEHTVQVILSTESYRLDIGHLVKQTCRPVKPLHLVKRAYCLSE